MLACCSPSRATGAHVSSIQETTAADNNTAHPAQRDPSDFSASALAPFRSPIFSAMWTASVISYFGGLIQSVGATWLMTSLAPSADMVALVQVATVLPIVLFSLPAGAAADVWDRRVVMLTAQVAMLAVAVALAWLALAGTMTPWLLLLLTFLIGAGGALYGPAWQASVREQVPGPDLPAAVSLNSAAFNLARAAGPALGGVLVAAYGSQLTFMVNAVSYLGLIAILLSWRRPNPSPSLPPEGMVRAMAAGLRFARLSHAIQAVLLRSALFGVTASGLWALMPLVARDLLQGGSSTYGLLLAAFGAGAVAAAFAGSALRARLSGEGIVASSSAAFGLAGLGATWSPGLSAAMPALFVCGAAWVLALSQFNLTVQIRTPRWVVGRALAIYQAAAFAGLSLGAWGWGLAATRFGLQTSLTCACLLLLATSGLGLLVRMPTTRPIEAEGGGDHSAGRPDLPLELSSGPIVANVEYRIDEQDVREFMVAAARLRRMRRRNGARRWALLRDAAHVEVWIERFEVPTWLDYLRLVEHMTGADTAVAERVRFFHRGSATPVSRFLLAHVPEGGGTEQPRDGRYERSAYDPSLAPTVTEATTTEARSQKRL